jgi:diguanylate cyclase (GGDEF)-like protein
VTDVDRQRLLIVEDDPEIQYLLSVVLDDGSREIVAVTSGDEAERVLAEGAVDLVVLDLILPDVDGRTLLAKMRARPETAAIPVIVVSARGGSEIRQDCYDLGADFFTEKPFDAEMLASDVSARLERAASQERGSSRDAVTGLLNLAGLAEAVPTDGEGYALALVQLDGFLALTEKWGWADSEEVVRQAASAFEAIAIGRVPTARIGGGEFAFLVPDSSLEDAPALAERLVDEVRGLRAVDPDGESIRLTASVGVVTIGPGTALDVAFDQARRRLFQARQGGGNQVLTADPASGESTARILVAEDDEISATILVHRLMKDGLEIIRFDNGREAYEAALDDPPNLVILDVKMPGMDGFEVLERLRRAPAYQSIPIILLTSMGSEADVVRGFQLGVDDYILKPFSPVELSARVWRLLRRGRTAGAV